MERRRDDSTACTGTHARGVVDLQFEHVVNTDRQVIVIKTAA
jgi:hypothetical protein